MDWMLCFLGIYSASFLFVIPILGVIGGCFPNKVVYTETKNEVTKHVTKYTRFKYNTYCTPEGLSLDISIFREYSDEFKYISEHRNEFFTNE